MLQFPLAEAVRVENMVLIQPELPHWPGFESAGHKTVAITRDAKGR